MDAATIIFYLLAAMTLGSALLAVTSRQIFRSAIYLLFSLIGIAGIYFWLDYAFIAAVQIVVYVGGIVVLIIFSIFLTQQAGEDLPKPKWTQQLFAALAAFCGFALVLVQVLQYGFTEVTQTGTAEVDRIGRLMLSTGEGGMAFPFELVSVLLLAAMIGCIVIAMRKPEEQKNNRTEEGRNGLNETGIMQKERKYDLSERLIEFSVSVIRLSDKVFKTSAGVYLSGQLVRSGTAPALLYGEAQSAESRNDFIHKVKILLKELRETKNNLRIIRTVPLIDDVAQIDAIIQKNDELISIFVASVETAKKNQQRK